MTVKSLIEGIAEDAATPIAQIGERFLMTAVLSAVAVASAAVAAVFLTSALYTIVEREFGGLEAMLAVGGLYVVLAAVFAIAVLLKGPARSSPPLQARKPAIGSLAAAAADGTGSAVPEQARQHGLRESETARALERLALPALNLLHEQGLERERIALAAAITAAKELRPWMLVGVMLVVGVAAGHLVRRR